MIGEHIFQELNEVESQISLEKIPTIKATQEYYNLRNENTIQSQEFDIND